MANQWKHAEEKMGAMLWAASEAACAVKEVDPEAAQYLGDIRAGLRYYLDGWRKLHSGDLKIRPTPKRLTPALR